MQKLKGSYVFSNLWHPHISGIQQSSLYFDDQSQYWIVASLRDKRFSLHQKHFSPDYPLGRIQWFSCMKDDGHRSCDEDAKKPLLLTFTSCVDQQFTCDSGHCVDNIGY